MQSVESPGPQTSERLLIVDDDPAQLRVLADLLGDEGFSVCTCRTAAEAMRAAGDNYVAAILDLRLPDQDGTQLLQQIRAVNPRIRVIIYTGYGSFGSAKEAVNRGAFAYVEKLGDPAELIRHVHRARAEEARRHAAELEDAVAQRTAELQESESRLRAIVDAAVDAILVISPDGIIDTFNPAAERLFGYPAAEALSRDVSFLFPPSHREEHLRWLADLAAGSLDNPTTRRETLGQRKDGSTFPVDAGVSVMRVGARCLFVEILRDLTERKRAEEQRLHLERQMRQAQKMEALGTLAGGVAHDFNNILTGIRGFADLALITLPPQSPEAGALSHVAQLTERAAGLVKQILAFSRKREQERTPLDLRRVVQESLTLVRATVPATIEIHHEMLDEPAIVQADATELHQVVMNLCGNAAHAMRARGGQLSLVIRPASLPTDGGKPDGTEAGDYLRLTVRDTGHGMTPEVKERIFDPFFTTKEAGEGTGMGLAVVLGIVEGLGGRILVDSEPGVGTSFDVYLPRTALPDARGVPAVIEPVAGKGRILLVDDEEFILNWAGTLLRRLGYEVETYCNSLEALDRFRADPAHFDLIITDQTMPKLTGAELVKSVMKLRPGMPVIMISGYSEAIDTERAGALGARAYLMKPFSGTQLAECVCAAISERP